MIVPGWLKQQLDAASAEVELWPEWMKGDVPKKSTRVIGAFLSQEARSLRLGVYRAAVNGALYKLIGVAVMGENAKELVIYEPVGNQYQLIAMPLENFLEKRIRRRKIVPRFSYVENA